MMWHKARAQPSESGDGRPHILGRSARCWGHFNFCFANVSRRVSARGIRCQKSVKAELSGWPATCTVGWVAELPPQINSGAHSLHL
jgi:hypothetical protein